LLFWGPHSYPPGAIEVKFCTAKRTHVFVDPAEFDMNRCNESPLRGEKPDFWPVGKFNTGSLPLRGILQVMVPIFLFSPVKTSMMVKQSCKRYFFEVFKYKIQNTFKKCI